MEYSEKQKIKELLRKAKYTKGKRLTKKEGNDILDGYVALKKLGVYDKPRFIEEARKEYHNGERFLKTTFD